MQSMFFENTVAEILALMGQDSNLAVRRTLARSRMLSSDVSAAYDPAYAEAFEKKNCAYFGKGMVINKYTGARGKSGSNDANAEYLARLRRIFDDNKVAFQTAELGKVDYGGGGTIAYIAALYGMEVVDSGVAGAGFLALAVMIFGQWKPFHIFGAAMFFAVFKSLANIADSTFLAQLHWSSNIYNMMPFVASMVILAFTSKNSMAPKAEGIPYDKGSR